MKYSEIVNVNENFQYSVNLQFDINNISKIKEYIPTKDGCDVLKWYFHSVLTGKNRSTTLIGPYGKGKSHLLLVLITLLNNYNESDEKYIEDFLNKVGKIDKELFDLISEVRKSKLKLLPIIINSNYNDLNQAFLLALSEALARDGLDKIVVNTYFDIALKVIEKWELNYHEAINNVKNCLEDYNVTLKELKKGLKVYSKKYYDIFKNIYSCILHGQEFNPLVNADIVKIYKDVTYEISNFGYNGIYIVFDEFSKFLECVDSGSMMKDLKILQDFAELADRTGKQEQIHLSCITHKTINEYLKNFSDDKVNAFKTVEGRFKEIYFNRSLEQNYEIISYSLIKQKNFPLIVNNYLESNSQFYELVKQLPIFKDVEGIENVLFKGCFPLNPITVYSLIELSEKVAQNERTLFTFLTDDDSFGLKKFIMNNGETLFSIDKIYDYFKPILKKENNDNIKSIFIKTENAIHKASNEIEKSILKSLSIIYMINDLENFMPDDLTIRLSINIPEDEYFKAVESLIEKSVLKRRKITNDLDFATIYNRELTKEIKTLTESKFESINEKDVIEKIMDDEYSLPRRYNENYKITRFFKNIFMTEEDIKNMTSFDVLLDTNYCDGLVINLLKTSRNIQEIIDHFQMINSNKVILKVPKSVFNKNFTDLLKEYESINYLKSSLSDNDLTNELNLMQTEISSAIIEAIKDYFSIENVQEYLYKDKIEKKVSNLSSFLSDICELVYNKTPIINNELINKKDLSAPIKKARNIVIESVLSNNKSLINSSTSAEATIYKAIVEKKDKESVSQVLDIIKNFIQKSDNHKQSFDKLYNILEKEPYSIRKGIIPILIAMSLYNYSDNIIIYFMNKEIDLDSSNLVKINDNPEKYYILTEKGTTEKIKYLASIMQIFSVPNMDTTRVNLKKLLDEMKRWILSLPRILREMNNPLESLGIKEEYLKIKSELLKPDINNNEFIYKKMMEIFDTEDYIYISNEINIMKNNFDSFIENYYLILIEQTKKIISSSFKGSLTSLLKEWYDKNDLRNSKTIYNLKVKEFIEYVSNFTTHNEMDVIEKLAKIITGYYIVDWQANQCDNYLEELKNIITAIKERKNIDSGRKILLIDGDETIEKNILQDDGISALGKTMKNNLEEIINEYGSSLSEQEKISVLLDIVRDYI